MNKWFEVVITFEDQEVFRDIVRSKEPRTAISNVLVNKYHGNVTKVEVAEVRAMVKVEKI